MSDINGKEIAELFIRLNTNLVYWSRLHLVEVFSTNGKGDETKLTTQQFHSLICIRDFGFNTVSLISEALCLSKSSASLSIAKMVEKGYIKKESATKNDDGRKIYLHLTEKGKAAAQATENGLMKITTNYFDSFDNETKLTLYEHLNTIIQILSTGGTKK